MASVNGLNRLGLPKLSENMDPEDARALRSYLYQMQEQLQYVLTNLDVENLSEELRTRLPTDPGLIGICPGNLGLTAGGNLTLLIVTYSYICFTHRSRITTYTIPRCEYAPLPILS